MKAASFFLASTLGLLLSGCGPTPNPEAQEVTWSVDHKDGNTYSITGSATYIAAAGRGRSSSYQPKVTLTDTNGCTLDVNLDTTTTDSRDLGAAVPVRWNSTATAKNPVKSATLKIDYVETNSATMNADGARFLDLLTEQKTLTPSHAAASKRLVACEVKKRAPDKRARLEDLPRNRQVALAINSAGFLCARVTDLYPDSAGQIIAHCVKYLSGRGRATYRIDPDAGQVELVS